MATKNIMIADIDQIIGKTVYGLVDSIDRKPYTDRIVDVKMVYASPYHRHVFLKNFGQITVETGYVDGNGRRAAKTVDYRD